VFAIVNGVLLRPLPYRDAERLMRLSEEHPGANSPLRVPMLSNLTYHAWSNSSTIDQFAAYSYDEYTVAYRDRSAFRDAANAERSRNGIFTPVVLIDGRIAGFFLPDDARAGVDTAVVLSDRLWRERFGAAPNIVGRGVVIDGRARTIVGVARPGFEFPAFERGGDGNAPLWTPLEVAQPSPDAVAGRRGRMTVLFAVARLRPGITPQQAEAEGTAAARSTIRPMAANLLFGVGGAPVVHVRGVVAELTSRVRPSLLVLGAAVVCVLMIACANVASLFLVRGVARQRGAHGSHRDRRQPRTRRAATADRERGVLGGRRCARPGAGVVPRRPDAGDRRAKLPPPRRGGHRRPRDRAPRRSSRSSPRAGHRTCAGAAQRARSDLAATLTAATAPAPAGSAARATWWRDGLLVGEAAFAVLLLVAAVLLARSFVRLLRVDPGYNPDHVLVAEMFQPEGDAADKGDDMRATVAAVVERVRALPGVVAAGAGNMMPLDAMSQIAGFPSPWTRPGAAPASARSLQYVVTPGYAEALGLRVKRGRLFRESDTASDVRPWIVNEEFARLYLPPDPVGYRWKVPATETTPERTNEIVGVIANVLKFGNDAPPQPEHYNVPRAPMRFYGHVEIAVRTSARAGSIAAPMRAAIAAIAPGAAIETVPLAQRVSDSVDQPRFALLVMTALASLAVALASVGLYGVLSYGVSQRRRELGVRAALGAARRDLVLLVVGDGLRVTAIGLAVGVVAAAALTRFMRSALFGIEPLDAASFLAAPTVLGVVAALACLLPARRAASTDPAAALRTD
jgi:hypothetical protein